MKSFFKKLAFVMAMAMVVSLAAPAAAKADTLPLYLAYQNETDKVLAHKLAVGETVDFCFQGAQAGWRDLERGWVSSNEAVATVDSNGLVTAVAEGTATITFKLAGYEDAKVQVAVENPAPEKAFDVVQVSDSKIEVQFPAATTYTANDVQFLITYANPYDETKPIEFSYKLAEKKLSDDKTTITLTAGSAFRDGQKFAVVIGGAREEITIKVAEPDSVKLIAKDDKLAADPLMDVYTTDKLSFSFKLMCGDIDVTSTYLPYVTNIVYNVETLDETKQALVPATPSADRLTCDVQFFEAELNAEISVAITYKINDAAEVTKTSEVLPIASNKYEEWDITGVYGWAILPHDYDAKKAVEWQTGKIELPADHTDDGKTYSIALLIKDNRGDSYVTHPKATEDGKNTYVYADAANPFKTRYALKFYPLSASDILMTEDGTLKVYKECTTGYYVGCVDLAAQAYSERYIWAADVKVIPGKQLDSASVANTTLSVLTRTELNDPAETTVKTEITAMTQYTGVALALDKTYFAYEIVAEDAVKDAFDVQVIDGKVYLVVDGTKLAGDNKTFVNVSVKVTENETRITKETQVVRVSVLDPVMDGGHIKYDTESRFMHNTVTKVTPKVSAVEIKEASVGADGVQSVTVKLQKTYNGIPVANIDPTTAGIKLATTQDQIDKVYTVEGDTYVVVRDPNGAIVPADKVRLTTNGVEIDLTAANAQTSEFKINAEGNYSVEVVTVRYRFKGTTVDTGYTTIRTDWKSGRFNFNVADKLTTVSYNGTENNAKFTNLPTSEDDQNGLKAIVVETLKFKRGDVADFVTADMIERVDAVVLGNQVIIKNVILKVPVVTGIHTVKEFYGLNVSVTKK